MEQALRKSDLDGSNVGKPLGNPEKLISAAELSGVAGVSIQMARQAISSHHWCGADLLARVILIGRGGAGGKALHVHVDS